MTSMDSLRDGARITAQSQPKRAPAGGGIAHPTSAAKCEVIVERLLSAASDLARTPKPSDTTLLRRFINWQVRCSAWFDQLLPDAVRIDGNRDFLDRLVPQHIHPGDLVYDVGGGKNPVITRSLKVNLELRLVGLDINASELAAAPDGVYDSVCCTDIISHRGAGDADLVICQALLEHVSDTGRALAAIAGILKPGGCALIFVPSRNALYARLNLFLPEGFKRRILQWIFPHMSRDHGFRAYYDRCTPAGLTRIARARGLIAERRHLYFQSSYFTFFFPLHAAWRIWLLLFHAWAGDEAAETFTMVLRKDSQRLE